MPSLVLRGVGEALSLDTEGDEGDEGEDGDMGGKGSEGGQEGGGREKVKKVLVLNATIDRETGPKSRPMTATDFVRAVAKAGEQSRRSDPHYRAEDNESTDANTDGVSDRDAEREKEGRLLKKYVTHLVYLDGQEIGGRLARSGTAPKVDVDELKWLGIKCVKVAGREEGDGKGVRYDEGGLGEALEGIMED